MAAIPLLKPYTGPALLSYGFSGRIYVTDLAGKNGDNGLFELEMLPQNFRHG